MKNKIISILCIFFILLSFLLMNSVFAYSIDDFYELPDETTLNYIFSHELYTCGTNNVFFYQNYPAASDGTTNFMVFFNKNLDITPIIEWSDEDSCYILNMGSDNERFDFVMVQNNYHHNSYTDNYLLDIKISKIFYSDCYVYNKTTNDYFIANGEEEEPNIIYPAISNTAEDLATGTFDYVLVAPGTFSNTENIGLNIYNITNLEENDDVYSQKPIFSTTLNSLSSFYKAIVVEDQTEFWFEIPRANLNIDFKNGNTYLYSLTLDGSPIQEIQATIGGLTQEDILNNNFDNLQTSIKESNKEVQESIDKQTEAIKENNKTNKNIFEKIGEILSYLNPFSENFFAYKLVELIVDGLKSLFIPADDFFSLYFDELNDWFSDRLGFLYYPLELLFDLLDRFLNINFAEPIINIPDIKEPFTNVTLIKSTSFNFNDLLENETLKNVHDIYFIIVDAVIYIGLVGLLYKKYEEVMTK